MAPRIDYEERFSIALRRILAYMTPAQLRRESSGRYGLEYTEALEMAYENVRDEAQAALSGYRRKKRSKLAQSVDAVDPVGERVTG
jgi:hypothetical protein